MINCLQYIGDDCIAIKGGSSFVYITNEACGPGHGIRYVKRLSFTFSSQNETWRTIKGSLNPKS